MTRQISVSPGEKELFEKAKRAALATQRHDWEHGAVAQALLEAGERELAILFAREAANRQAEDGRASHLGDEISETDPCAIGEVLLFAAEETRDPVFARAVEKLLRWALKDAPRSAEGTVYHLCGTREFWVDSLYMLPPFLARAGFPEEAMRQIDGYWNALFLPEKGLLAHRYDEGTGRFVRADVWGVGNGWAMAGMARVRALLPDRMAGEKERLAERIRILLENAAPYQNPDGSFPNVLDDPRSFPELNFGQTAAYTVYRGMREGWLGDRYFETAEKAFRASCAGVDPYGFVRDVCGVPDFDRPGAAPEGQAFFLLMCAARRALAGEKI